MNIPNAIPIAHIAPIKVSSRWYAFLDIIPSMELEKTLKIIAVKRGLYPKNNPRPIPPNAACDMPPDMKTNLLTTTYEPITPQAIAAKIPAITAFWKKTY
jgi:hypothetical protein